MDRLSHFLDLLRLKVDQSGEQGMQEWAVPLCKFGFPLPTSLSTSKCLEVETECAVEETSAHDDGSILDSG